MVRPDDAALWFQGQLPDLFDDPSSSGPSSPPPPCRKPKDILTLVLRSPVFHSLRVCRGVPVASTYVTLVTRPWPAVPGAGLSTANSSSTSWVPPPSSSSHLPGGEVADSSVSVGVSRSSSNIARRAVSWTLPSEPHHPQSNNNNNSGGDGGSLCFYCRGGGSNATEGEVGGSSGGASECGGVDDDESRTSPSSHPLFETTTTTTSSAATVDGMAELSQFVREHGPVFQIVQPTATSVTLYSLRSDPRRAQRRRSSTTIMASSQFGASALSPE